MAADFDNFNYKNHKLDCIFTFISNLEISEYAIQSLKAIVLYDFFENQQNNDKYTKYLDSEIIEMQIPQIEYAPLSHCTTGIHYPEQLSRYINRLLFQLERINIPNFEAQLSIHNHLSDDYFETYSDTVPLCDVLKMHGYEEQADLFTHEYLGKNTLKHFAYDIFSLRGRLEIPEKNDYPNQSFPNVPTFDEVFFNYIDTATYSYTRYDYTKYISDWLYCRVTLPNWKHHKKIKIFDFLSSWHLEADLLDVIHNHALSLYNTYVNSFFCNYYKDRFEKHNDQELMTKFAIKDKDIILNLHLSNTSGIDKDYLNSNLFIKDLNLVSKQLQNVNNISHHTLSNINIHNPNSTVVTDALLLYKEYLVDFLNPQKKIIQDHDLYDFINFDTTEIKKTLSPDSTPEKMSFKNEHVPIFDGYKSMFLIDGCITLGKHPVFALWLGVFLNDRNVLVRNHTTKLEERLDGRKYRDSYFQGFNDGAKYFQDTYKFSSAEFYSNATSIVPDLKQQYDNANCDFGYGYSSTFGWKVIKDPICFIKIAHKSINKFGYYSGIVYSLTAMSEKYSIHFKGFFDSDKPVIPDYRFQLSQSDYFVNSFPSISEIFESASDRIKDFGFFEFAYKSDTIKIFRAHLVAFFFSDKPIHALNVDNNDEPSTIIGKSYLESFVSSYKEGVEYFNKNYSLLHNEEIRLFYADNPVSYVKFLESKYFAKDFKDEATYNHWNFVTYKDLFLISHKEIKKYGFYSGIVGEVKSLIAKHSDLFKDFYNSDNKIDVPEANLTYILAEDFLENLSEKNLSYHEFSILSFTKGYVNYDNKIFNCKFFNYQLFTILFCPEPLDAIIPITNRPVTFKGSDFFKTYIDAYKEGEEFFVKTYNFDQYKPEALVETIKLLYFPKDNTNINNRNYWSFVKVMNPFIISHAIVKEYGYNSGIINKVHELIEIHPILFKDFYNNSPIPTPPALFPVDTPIINTDISKITVLTDLKESNNNSIFNTESIDLIHNVLKSHFVGFEDDLLKALNGDKLDRPLFFKGNQNQLTEFFLRAKYNNLISCTKKEIENWLCSNFSYKNRKNIVNLLNASTVWDVLTKPEKGPTKLNRICISEDFPYKPTSERSE